MLGVLKFWVDLYVCGYRTDARLGCSTECGASRRSVISKFTEQNVCFIENFHPQIDLRNTYKQAKNIEETRQIY